MQPSGRRDDSDERQARVERSALLRPRSLAQVRLALSSLPCYLVVLSADVDFSKIQSEPALTAIARLLLPIVGRERASRVLEDLQRDGRGVVATCHRELAELYRDELRRLGLSCSIIPA